MLSLWNVHGSWLWSIFHNANILLKTSRVYCSKRRDHNGSFQSQHFLHGCTSKFTSNSYFLQINLEAILLPLVNGTMTWTEHLFMVLKQYGGTFAESCCRGQNQSTAFFTVDPNVHTGAFLTAFYCHFDHPEQYQTMLLPVKNSQLILTCKCTYYM